MSKNNNVYSLIKTYSIAKNGNHHLNFQWVRVVIYLLEEDLASILLKTQYLQSAIKWGMLVTHWNLTITLSILQGFHIWALTMSNFFKRQVFLEHQFYHVMGTLKVYGFFTFVPIHWFTYVKGKNGGCSLLGERKIYKAPKIKNPSLIKTLPQNQVLTLQANINNYIT